MYVLLHTHDFEINVILKDKSYKPDRPIILQNYSEMVGKYILFLFSYKNAIFLLIILDIIIDKRTDRKSVGQLTEILKESKDKYNIEKQNSKKVKAFRNKMYFHLMYPKPEIVNSFPV